jgi:MerR family transcriptional regulator, repressor of the yfmOP operon
MAAPAAQPAGFLRPIDEQSEQLLSIGAAAACAGISERALRYYQQLGLITPAGCTKGGLRRYSRDDLARVAWIRQMQTLLGLSLDEIAAVLRTEDRLAQIRHAYQNEALTDAERIGLVAESVSLQKDLRSTVEAKRRAIDAFLADLDARISRKSEFLAQLTGQPDSAEIRLDASAK